MTIRTPHIIGGEEVHADGATMDVTIPSTGAVRGTVAVNGGRWPARVERAVMGVISSILVKKDRGRT